MTCTGSILQKVIKTADTGVTAAAAVGCRLRGASPPPVQQQQEFGRGGPAPPRSSRNSAGGGPLQQQQEFAPSRGGPAPPEVLPVHGLAHEASESFLRESRKAVRMMLYEGWPNRSMVVISHAMSMITDPPSQIHHREGPP